ncbi:MAG TPA: sulfur oxidation c-type cytochrome SoxX [Hyphomicrobiaceae bacterium]|nr:sulfur oxidation c-type cytochrome SoxX [Hyphomicrobiaceae bacterium]
MAAIILATLPSASATLSEFNVRGDAVDAPLAGRAGDALRGRAIVLDRSRGNCLICHALPSTNEPFQGVIGPSLEGVARRLTAGQIRLRMIDQSRINPATIMPPFYRIRNLWNVALEYRGMPAFNAQEIEDVVAYLATLKE